MGLTERVVGAATRRPHVLVVPVPGYAPLRWAAEDALDALGWPQAASPAAADVLLVCGPAGPELAAHVDVAWDAMPGPRVRATTDASGRPDDVLAAARTQLADLAAQRRDAAVRPAPPLSAAEAGGKAGGHDMGGHDMGGHDMGGHDMGMDLPGGLVMADRVEDRDGLRLEGLHLSLGPLLPGWPAGLQLDTVLSGDVLVEVDLQRLDPRAEPAAAAQVRALDALALLLEAAGWPEGALRARRSRSARTAGAADGDLPRLHRARLLRWSLRGLPGPAGVDLCAHLDVLLAAVRGEAVLPLAREDELVAALVGLDLGTASLVLAAHGPLLMVDERV